MENFCPLIELDFERTYLGNRMNNLFSWMQPPGNLVISMVMVSEIKCEYT